MRKPLLLFAAATTAALAQVSSSVLFGDAHDPSGARVPGAAIVATQITTGFTRAVTSGTLGEYRIEDLRPGQYTITVSKDGFRKLVISGLTLEVNQKAQMDLALSLGEERDQVAVTADATLLQPGDASSGYLLRYSTVHALPLVGRNISNLVSLGPGAIPRHLGGFGHDIINDLQGNRGAVAFNPPVNGARSTMNVNILDGAYNTDRNTYAVVIAPPMESVQEFRVQSSLAPAQAAQAGGAVIDVVTKSGSKEFHGNAFEFLRNEATDAFGVFADRKLPKAVFRQNQYGATLGGPLGIPSTFFFGTYEGLRNKSTRSRLRLVPDEPLRQGDFTNRAPLFDPLSLDPSGARRPFAGNRIPSARIDPIATRYLNTYQPLPNRVAAGGPNYLDATPSTDKSDNALFRVDHQSARQGRLFARYTINDQRTRAAGFFPQLPTLEDLRGQQAALGHTSVFGGWVNEARLSFTRLGVLDLPESAFRSNVIRELGMNPGGASEDPVLFGLPFFIVGSFATVTDSPTLPQVQRDNTWHLTDGLSITRGRHTLQAGFQWIHFQLNYLQSQFPRGQYLYTGVFTSNLASPAGTGEAFSDFLLGYPQTTRRFAGLAQAYMREHSAAVYLQDDYRVSSRITLNLGLRYEYISPFSEKRNNMLNLDYSKLPAVPTLRRVSRAVNPDRNNFAPRLGIAWRLRGEMVFRAGYGIYYQPEIAVETYDLVRNGLRNEVNQTSGTTPLLTTRDGFPQNGSLGLPTYFGIDPHARTPYMQQWSAGLQRQLAAGLIGEVSYIGTKGTHLGRFRTFNTPAHVETGENLGPRPGELQSLRTFPQLGPLYQRQHIANSSYHSLQLKVEKRFRRGLSFLASFVWAKSIDDADTVIPGLFDSIGAQDERNLRLERGLSFFDVRRRFSAGYSYQIPSSRFLTRVLSSWETSGIVTIQDGTPLNPVYFGADFANSGTPNRPNVVPGQSVRLPSSQRNADQFFNRNAFSDPARLTFGNAGRNTLPGPPNNVFDLAIHRRFKVAERASMQVRVEGFNVFNHPNWGIPGSYPDFGPSFGKIFVAGEQRRLQFGLRFDF